MDLQAFLADFMQKDDLALLAKDIYDLFRCPVMVVDMAFRAIAWHQPADFRDPPFQSTIDRGRLSYEISSFTVGDVAHEVTLPDSPYRRRFSPLVSGGAPVGYLILVDVDETLHGVDGAVFSTVESALAKQLTLELNRSGPTQNTEEAVLQSLLEGRFADESLFQLQAAAAGMQHFAPKRLALVNIDLYLTANWPENTLRHAITDRFPRSRPLLHGGHVLFFLNSDLDMRLFRDLSEQYALRIVVSAPIPRLFELGTAYGAALELMNCLLKHRDGPFAVPSEPYHALMMLKRLAGRGDLVLPQVRALAEQDAAEQTPYCLTLYTSLCCHRSLQQTCERLYTHRNTVLYRVRRMRDDFEIPLDDPAQQLALMLSSALVLLEQGREALFMPQEAEETP